VIIRFRLSSELHVEDTAYSPAVYVTVCAPSWTRTAVADGHKFSAVRRLSLRLLESGPVVKRNFYLPHLHLAPPLGWFRRNFIDNWGYLLHEKSSVSLDYSAALSAWSYVYIAVLVQLRLMTDKQTDRRTRDDNKCLANIKSRGQKSHLKACSKEWPWTWLKVIGIASSDYATYHLLLAVCIGNNDSIWHSFRYISTFTVYVTGCGFQKSFVFDKIVEIRSHVRFPIHV